MIPIRVSSDMIHWRSALFSFLVFPGIAIGQDPGADPVPGEPELRAALEFAKEKLRLEEAEDVERLFEILEKSLDEGYPSPSRLLGEPSLQPLLTGPEHRSRLSRLLRDHARESEVRIGPAGEPGRPLSLRVRFEKADGEPAAGALVFLYQADARGYYAPEAEKPGEGNRNPRLFAWLKTDAEGRIRVQSVLPGGYGGAPPHFHVGVAPDGEVGGKRTGGSLYLEGDWPMDDEVYSDAKAGAAWVVPVVEREGAFEARGTLRLR